MKYTYKYADIIEQMPEYVTGQCISADCVMGAGVVMAFRQAFPLLKGACTEYSANKNGNVIGQTFRYSTLSRGTCYNFFTKGNVNIHCDRGISEDDYLANLKKCLIQTKRMMLENGEQKLALPKIGAGIDNCTWERVEDTIKSVFEDTNFKIVICLLK